MPFRAGLLSHWVIMVVDLSVGKLSEQRLRWVFIVAMPGTGAMLTTAMIIAT